MNNFTDFSLPKKNQLFSTVPCSLLPVPFLVLFPVPYSLLPFAINPMFTTQIQTL
ncbi:hypothetical protein [Moorena sp. SIO3I6]|uniref:hypothetical protein n=1 Tax=Moorena sp. SIO3I6 TaxID=2607831 RepID=UPI0013FC2ADF|nr:hypothetical protein [Moorena sp. SIO3I6]NEP21875.1 hypothetical protein [Moorena sp. SIO3I6]